MATIGDGSAAAALEVEAGTADVVISNIASGIAGVGADITPLKTWAEFDALKDEDILTANMKHKDWMQLTAILFRKNPHRVRQKRKQANRRYGAAVHDARKKHRIKRLEKTVDELAAALTETRAEFGRLITFAREYGIPAETPELMDAVMAFDAKNKAVHKAREAVRPVPKIRKSTRSVKALPKVVRPPPME